LVVGSDHAPTTGEGTWDVFAELQEIDPVVREANAWPLDGWHEVVQTECSRGQATVLIPDPPLKEEEEPGPWAMKVKSELLVYPVSDYPDRLKDAREFYTLEKRHHSKGVNFLPTPQKRRATAGTAAYALTVLKAKFKSRAERFPGASLMCCGCLCANQELSVNVFTFTYYCFVLALRLKEMNIIQFEVEPNRYKGSRECFEQARAEMDGEEFREAIETTLADAQRLFNLEVDGPILQDILASTMKRAVFVRKKEGCSVPFGNSVTLWNLRELVLGQNDERMRRCEREVRETWSHFSTLGGKPLDDELYDLVE
jgi:hypothetical protein